MPDLIRPSFQSEVNVIHSQSIKGVNEPLDGYRPAFWVSGVRSWLHILFQLVNYFLVRHCFTYRLCPQSLSTVCQLYFSLCSSLCRADFFSFASCRLMLLSVFYLLLTVSVFFTFFPSSFVFLLGLLSGALWGNVSSLCLSIYPCACLHVCVFYLSQPVSFTEFIEAAALLSSQLNVLNKCHISLFCFSYQPCHHHNNRCWHLVCLCYVTVFVLHLYQVR